MEKRLFLEILSRHTSLEQGKIKDEMSFADDLGIDQLELSDILSILEDEFEVEMDEADLVQSIETVGELFEILKYKLDEYED